MSVLHAKNAALYVAGTQYSGSTSLTVSIERPVTEVAIHQSTYNERDIGQVSGSFSGNAIVDSTEATLFGYVTTGTTQNIAIYPTNDSTDYWMFAGFFNSYSATGPADGFWAVDFAGVVDGTITATAFS